MVFIVKMIKSDRHNIQIKKIRTKKKNVILVCLVYSTKAKKIYNAIKSLYQHTMSSVRLNKYMLEWFPVTSGVKQDDNLSPILFCLYINDLALTFKENNIGVNIDGHTICILLYADDIVLLAENEKDLLLDITQDWCYKWKMNINVEKSKIMHFRKNKKKQSNVNFSFGDTPLQYCES